MPIKQTANLRAEICAVYISLLMKTIAAYETAYPANEHCHIK
jgi:hypothetical protein